MMCPVGGRPGLRESGARPAPGSGPLPKDPPNDDIGVKELRAAWDRLNPRTPFSSLNWSGLAWRPRAYRPARPSRADPVDPMACAGWPAEPGRAGHRWRFECMLGPRLWPTQGQSRAKQWRMAFRGWSPPALRFRSKWIGAIARGALHDRGVAAIVRSSGVRRIESVAGPVCLAHRV